MKLFKDPSKIRNVAIVLLFIFFGVLASMAISKETPLGAVSGRVISQKNKRPIAGAKVYHPGRISYSKTDNEGRFTLYGVPEGRHTIRVYAKGFYSAYNNKVKVKEGVTTEKINFSMIRRPSEYYMYAYQKVFPPKKDPMISFRGYLVKKVHLKVYKINPAHYLGFLSQNRKWAKLSTDNMEPVYEQDYTATFNEDGDFHGSLRLPLNDPGLYIVKAKAVKGQMRRSTWVMKTDLGMILKRSPEQLLVYAQRFSDGSPVKNSIIRVYGTNYKRTWRKDAGATDKDGVFFKKYYTNRAFKIFANSGLNYAYGRTYSARHPRQYKTYLYTERPVYRPGQIVFFKGIVRKKVGHNYHVMRGLPVRIRIKDTRGNEIQEKTYFTNKYGTINGSLKLDEEPPLGRYSIYAEVQNSSSYGSFQVAEYRKPEFKVDVKTDRNHYVAGDKIKVKVKGKYYFGAPVKGANYNLTVYESTYRWSRWSWYSYGSDTNSYGGIMFETSGKLDENGEAELTIPTKKIDRSKYLSFEAEVSDLSGRAVTNSAGAPLSVGEFAVYARPEKYIYNPGQEVDVSIEAMDYNEKPVRNQKIKITINKIEYKEVKERKSYRDRNGRLHHYDEYRLKRFEKRVGSVRQEITDDKGKAKFAFTPEKSGSYEIDLISHDKRNNRITYTAYTYVSGGDTGRIMSQADVEIITDKKQYKQGETVKAIVSASEPGSHVLVTLEGRKIFFKRVIHLKNGSKTIEFPLKKEYFPNVFLTATYIKDMSMVSTRKNIKMNRDEKKLNITITPDKKRYRPGEKAKYKVAVKDQNGKPVEAEISLGVVDQAIYAIAPENTPDIHKFFWGYEYNKVTTSYSFYKDYSGGADKFPDDDIRKKFEDTAKWSPTVKTDRNGEAVVEFTMPDNLTTWVGTVRAASMNTLVGSKVNEVLCTKDLLVRLETPRFFTQKDRVQIGGVVHNYTKKKQHVKVWLEVKGAQRKGLNRQIADIKPDGAKDFYWQVNAVKPGTATLTLYCTGTDAKDAMRLKVPVQPFGVENVIAKSGKMDNKTANASAGMKLPPNTIKEASEMKINTAPSLAGTMLENLDYLVRYPYGCVEQTMSPTRAAVIVKRAMTRLRLKDQKLKKKIDKVVNKGLRKIAAMQNYKGGWGWWSNGKSHPIMTAYVVQGLKEAQKNGFPVNTYKLKRGISALKKMIRTELKPVQTLGGAYQADEEWNTRAYLLYTLYKIGSPDKKKTLQAFENRKAMNEYALAMLAMTLDGMGDIHLANQVLADLDASAVIDKGKCHWNGRTFTYSWMDNNIETTAYCLMAYVQIKPSDPKIPMVINWLVRKRQGRRYSSTKDTAAVIYALTTYLLKSKESNPDYRMNVSVNQQKLVSDYLVDSLVVPEKDRTHTAGFKMLKTGINNAAFQKKGKGALYYTVRLKYFLQADVINPLNKGMKVTRKYNLITRQKNRQGVIQEVLEPLPDRPLKRGEKVRVTVAVKPDAGYRYVIIEDPLPAGFEVDIRESEKNRGYFWAHREVRDEKVAFFFTRMEKNKPVKMTYDLRAEMFGKVKVKPSMAYCMYEPEVRGNSKSDILEVRPDR